MDFKRLEAMTEELSHTNSIIEKRHILSKYEDMKDILYWTYNPYIKFYVSARNIKKFMSSKDRSGGVYAVNDIYELLRLLHKREATGNDALFSCEFFINRNKEHEPVILKILNKDLECGINVKTINSAFTELIPQFEVPLANKYNPEKHDIFNGHWLLSRKLDGIRCLIFIYSNEIKCMTREGFEIVTLGKIKEELKQKWEFTYPIILDGELCIYKNGFEDFNSILSLYNRNNFTIEDPMFYVFDCYSINEFTQGYSDENYVPKILALKQKLRDFKYIKFLEQISLEDESQLIIPYGWEGFIARRNEETLFKRSNSLLKIKEFMEEEFKVLTFKSSEMIIDGVLTPIVGSLVVEYKENTVDVGSGLSQEQRIDWLLNPEKIVGKTITVKYFSESVDKTGKASLRFPIFKRIFEKYEEDDMF